MRHVHSVHLGHAHLLKQKHKVHKALEAGNVEAAGQQTSAANLFQSCETPASSLN